MWADKEAAIRFRLSAGHVHVSGFSTPAGLRGVVLPPNDIRRSRRPSNIMISCLRFRE
jgi:hypothetical protein